MLPTVIILAGGLGTRLRATVPEVPKALAPVAGRPFLKWLLEWLSGKGVAKVVLAVGYRAEMIETEIGSQFGPMEVVYSKESAPLGTGGALQRALALVDSSEALVLNGDTFADVDLIALVDTHRANRARVTVVTVSVPDARRYGTVSSDGTLIHGFAASGTPGPGTINAGMYVVSTSLLDGMSQEPFSFERDVLQARIAELLPRSFRGGSSFIDIGTPEDYARAQEYFSGWDTCK